MEDNGTRIPTEAGNGSPPVTGPFETEREAHAAAIEHAGPPREGWSILSESQHLDMLMDACADAGIAVGTYDSRILHWLAGYEDSTCAVIAGLVGRAHAAGAAILAGNAGLTPDQLATALDALDVAADYRRDRVETCPDCPGRPEGLCSTCEWRLDRADEYDALARDLGGES
jgi:hypothetical protein